MAGWFIPALKAVLPHVGTIITAAKPVFTRQPVDEGPGQVALLQRQITELQPAVLQNASNIQELATQLQTTVTTLEQTAAAAEPQARAAARHICPSAVRRRARGGSFGPAEPLRKRSIAMRVALTCLAALALVGAAAASEVARELVNTSLMEDGKPVRLELLVRKPEGPGPFPTVVFNHGSTGRGNDPSLFRRSWWSPNLATYFVDRGWMVIFPQRRGRGASDGRYDEGFEPDRSRYSCHTNLSLAGVDRAIEDLDAVMSHVKARPDVLLNRMLIGGQSRGGILAMAYAGERPESFIGVVNFVGGWIGEWCMNSAAINSRTFKRGGKFPRPTLWLYGEDDRFYSVAHSKANYEAFRAAGGTGQFESFSVPGTNAGHSLIAHPALWIEHLTKYLEILQARLN